MLYPPVLQDTATHRRLCDFTDDGAVPDPVTNYTSQTVSRDIGEA